MASAAQLAAHPNKSSPEFFRSFKRSAVLSLLLALVTLVSYNPVTHNDFVSFDDPGYIVSNAAVRSGLSWGTVRWAFRSTEQGNWHPITWISHALDCQVFRLNPAGHHYMGALLHALAAVLIFLFLQSATGFCWRSLVVAALFAVHPLNVESVAWASERKSVLCMLFFVLTAMAYRWYTQQSTWQRYSLIVLLFALGLMSKPMLVTLPFLLLLLDYWPLERTRVTSPARLIGEKLPLLLMSLSSSLITISAQGTHKAIHSADFTVSNRLQNAIVSYARYLEKAFWPSKLASFYPHPVHIPVWETVLGVLVLGALTFAVVRYREHKYLAVGWLWFLGTLVPVIGLVQVGEQGMADRYAYLPFVGLFIAMVWGAAELARSQKVSASYLSVAACCVLTAFALVTRHQIGFWQNTNTLWIHALSVTEGNYVAEANLGAELISEGDIQQAILHLKNGIAINPRDPFSHLDLGVCEKRMGNIGEAVQEYQTALSLAANPDLRGTAYGNLGTIYRIAGNYPLATQNYELALQAIPDDPLSLTGLGLISDKNGNAAAAITYFSRATKVRRSDFEFLLLSQAFAKAGMQAEAQAAYAQAHNLSSNWDGTLALVNHLLQE